ncbi:MAG: rhamnogalacturonan lyase [Bacteroidota bacterium]|nr:rhamnogalacturonan lyase [Bacteroidota bacterium]
MPTQASKRQMESLDRGVVAVKTNNGVYISWRMLATDNPAVKFNVYCGTRKVNLIPISNSTNTTDLYGQTSSLYTVRTILNGVEIDTTKAVTPWADFYKTIQLNRPAGGKNASGSYMYTPNDCSVGDLDGDGQYEIVLKWDPTDSQDNSNSGYTGNVYLDAYKLDGTQLWRIDLGINIRAGAHYTQFMVYDLDGDGYAEVACKTAPGTKDGTGAYVLMKNDSPNADYRNSSGYVLSGPEYLTVFDGRTGAQLNTIAYNPPRGTVSAWGDSYGNRVDRFLACIAYLDGIHPSLVMGRGYYTRTTLTAYDFLDGKLVQRWYHNSDIKGSGAYGQGNHNLAVGDVDNDGKDEIIYGSCAFDDDGSLLYRTGLGHGDAMHLSDLDPDLAGLEVWEVHEDTAVAYGYELHNAATGKIIWGANANTDNGRGLAADISSASRGFEMWSAAGTGVYSCKGVQLSTKKPSVNFRVYWDADLQDELLDGTKLDKWTGNGTDRLISFYNYSNAHEINGTKANPCLSADILGDWREEILYYDSSDSSKLVLFTTTTYTTNRIYTLMHDPVYRLSVAWQNVVYNQPPHLGFYIGDGLSNMPWPDIYLAGKSFVTSSVQPSVQPSILAYSAADGTIRIKSKEQILNLTVISMDGMTLYHEKNVQSIDKSLSIQPEHAIRLVKVETKTGVQIVKVLH